MAFSGETLELGVAATPQAEAPRRTARKALVPVAVALALFGALFASRSSASAPEGEQIAGALSRLATQQTATYDDCKIMRMGAHGCVQKTTLLHNGSSIDCHEVSNFALDYFCGDNHTNTAAMMHLANAQLNAGNECDLVETFLSTCMSSEGIFCEAYSIQASVAAKNYLSCDSEATESANKGRKTPWFSSQNDTAAKHATNPK